MLNNNDMNDINCFELVDINETGIIVKSGKTIINISFDECAKNYADERSIEASRCIATRDITELTFTFYTRPKIRVVFKKHFIKDLLPGKSAVSKFLKLQKAINRYGYNSYDLS